MAAHSTKDMLTLRPVTLDTSARGSIAFFQHMHTYQYATQSFWSLQPVRCLNRKWPTEGLIRGNYTEIQKIPCPVSVG